MLTLSLGIFLTGGVGFVAKPICLLLRWLYDLLSIRLTGRERYYPRYRQELSGMADRVDMDRLLKVLKTVNDRKRVADHPLVPRLVLEDMLLDYRKIFSPSASK